MRCRCAVDGRLSTDVDEFMSRTPSRRLPAVCGRVWVGRSRAAGVAALCGRFSWNSSCDEDARLWSRTGAGPGSTSTGRSPVECVGANSRATTKSSSHGGATAARKLAPLRRRSAAWNCRVRGVSAASARPCDHPLALRGLCLLPPTGRPSRCTASKLNFVTVRACTAALFR